MPATVNYVSLGDSIATGTLTPFSSIFSYVLYLKKKFCENGYKPDIYPLACDGDTSYDLLWKINHSYQFRKIIKKANFITISIGGNDLLRAMSIPDFTRIHIHKANDGLKSFINNWPKIIDTIRSINQEAKIVVLSLYNPYNHSEYLGRKYCNDRNLCELTDQFLVQINSFLAANSENKYIIADIYSTFKRFSKGDMYKVSCLYQDALLRNPHPTPEAQRMIADIIFEKFTI